MKGPALGGKRGLITSCCPPLSSAIEGIPLLLESFKGEMATLKPLQLRRNSSSEMGTELQGVSAVSGSSAPVLAVHLGVASGMRACGVKPDPPE